MLIALYVWNLIAAGLWLVLLSTRVRYTMDKQDTGALALFFLAGCASIFITLIIHGVYPLRFVAPFVYGHNFLRHVLVVGPIEETAKFLAFLSVAHALRTTKEPQDGVIQGAVVGLGFGTIENISYIERFGAAVFFRPILTSGGHAVYGAIWGGLYSAAVYANYHSKDPAAYRIAFGGVAMVALLHGLFNASLRVSVALSYALDIAALATAIVIFVRLVEHSPYRQFPLQQADLAIPNIRRGLHFNPKSTILNRNLGLYLMYRGEYRAAAKHLARSIPRAFDPRRARFFIAVSELVWVPEVHAMRRMRRAWAHLSDEQRTKLLAQLDQLLENDPALIERVHDFINRAFKPRNWQPAHELARELRRRKADRRMATGPRSAVFDELLSGMSRDEIRRLAAQVGKR
ncbi:MAG: PrsW family intramembrane metalloprotease [Spirochaetaceae bacterium]|nr:MAG: PrsW family intramembrane metalloprotease [Spirochaetaceae bacterium]